MTVQYSIQKMVSDGALSTVVLGIQYLQRNDIYIRIAGVDTPQSGAPSGYTWSFINNTTIKILPVVPNGVEVVIYRRTDVNAMYNVYSQNAQFDEATIDENNTQLLYIAQEYLEQGLPGAGIDTIEFLRDDGINTYYRIKRTDGSYSDEFAVPSVGSYANVLVRESIRRSYAAYGFNLVAGSFQYGFTIVTVNDVVLDETTGKVYSGAAGTYPADTSTLGFHDVSAVLNGRVYLESFGYGAAGNTPTQNYTALQKFYEWLANQPSVGVVLHPPRKVEIQTTVTANATKFLGADITNIPSFVFDFNGGELSDITDVSANNAQHVLFVIKNAKVVSFLNSNVSGAMGLPSSVRGGMTLCRAYDSGYVSFEGTARGIINHVETRDCGVLHIKAECDTVRYPFLVYRCKSFDVTLSNKNCWRDYFIQGAESGVFHITSDAPRQHSMFKSYSSTMVNCNIDGFYKVRNRPLDTIPTPTGQFGFEIESDEQAIFRNIHITVDIEGNYERPIMLRNFKSDATDQTVSKGHVLQNIKISGRIRNLSGVTGNIFLLGGGYYSGDFVQSLSLSDLTISGPFVMNIAQLLAAISYESKMKWYNLTLTDGYLESHVTGFYKDYVETLNTTFVGKAYSSNNPLSLGCLEFERRFVGDIAAGIPILTLDNTRTMNHVVVEYCATASETTFNPFIDGRLSGLVVFPTSGVVSETTVDTQFAKQGTAGVADLFEVSPGVFGIRIPTWTAPTAMLQVRVFIKYHSYGEGDFSSVPGLVYYPYRAV